jgi:hypothetical protein
MEGEGVENNNGRVESSKGSHFALVIRRTS